MPSHFECPNPNCKRLVTAKFLYAGECAHCTKTGEPMPEDINYEYHQAQKYLDEIKAPKSEGNADDKPLYSLMGRIKAVVDKFISDQGEDQRVQNRIDRDTADEIAGLKERIRDLEIEARGY